VKTLVVTDNPHALEISRELQERHGDIDVCQSPSGALEGIERVDVKEEWPRLVDEYGLVLSIHCKQLFPKGLVDGTRCVNVHPGLNPHNRGWYPQVFSLINGLPAGVTLHEIDAQLDHGAIIAQQELELRSWDTSGSVYQELMRLEAELVRAWFVPIRDGDYTARTPQSEGNLNLRRDFEALRELDLDERGRLGDFLDRLRALAHPPFRNAWFRDGDGRRVWIRVELEPDED
jgi:methionyl-tRNA formyltransferase